MALSSTTRTLSGLFAEGRAACIGVAVGEGAVDGIETVSSDPGEEGAVSTAFAAS